jgi:protein SCO1/2
MMSKKLALALVLGVLAGAAAAYMTLNVPSTSGPLLSTGRAAIGGPFTLTDTTGRRRTEKDFAGKPMLVYFGFTNCPDICPSGLQTLTVALDKLGDKAERLTPLFITIDPERDTPQTLAAYIKSFHPRIQALSGSVEDVQAAIKTYRVYAVKVPDASDPKRYNIDHSSFFYLMNAEGRYVKHFPHSTDAGTLAEALAAAL